MVSAWTDKTDRDPRYFYGEIYLFSEYIHLQSLENARKDAGIRQEEKVISVPQNSRPSWS